MGTECYHRARRERSVTRGTCASELLRSAVLVALGGRALLYPLGISTVWTAGGTCSQFKAAAGLVLLCFLTPDAHSWDGNLKFGAQVQ